MGNSALTRLLLGLVLVVVVFAALVGLGNQWRSQATGEAGSPLALPVGIVPGASTSPLALASPLPSPPVSPLPAAVSPLPTPAGAVSGAGTPVYGYRVVNVYPHDPNAFTQGLVFFDGFLYEGTGLRGRSSLRKVELESGQVLQQVDLPDQYFGEGIALWEDRIFQLTWQARVGFVYDRESFSLLEEFAYATEGWGLTQDGTHLIMSDGTANLYFLEPTTLEVVRQVEVRDGAQPVTRLNELEYVEGEIYANIWQTDRIARIDPASGQVVAWVDLAGLLPPADRGQPVDVLNGIAYDSEAKRLFVTGKLWPKLFEIELIPPG
ncbi:glutaminyl-peptide cyclotransferase [Litorilinea aerophila]|uniref:Glutaminyl-peptide cyclotransferase n=1 Tax=Litorilinea aerophila TaxID=1204385 RepID=A0A540VH49_9CHLR|nr:glutaminyl-peptide cyclotransferase [Litorilinea aerophila]MCC9076139.1 glutaminyl-peptide cyclotransferase [Litorilinea aerophila]